MQAREAERWVSESNVQELANTARAFATVHHLDAKCIVSTRQLGGRQCLGDYDGEPIEEPRQHGMGQSTLQLCGLVAWASARVKMSDEKLLAVLPMATQRRMSEFNAQSLANTACASAT